MRRRSSMYDSTAMIIATMLMMKVRRPIVISILWFAVFDILVFNVIHRPTDGDLALATDVSSAVV